MTDLEEVPEQPEGFCQHGARLFDHTKPYSGKVPQLPPYCTCCGQPRNPTRTAALCSFCFDGTFGVDTGDPRNVMHDARAERNLQKNKLFGQFGHRYGTKLGPK